jgi:hypothetical protein
MMAQSPGLWEIDMTTIYESWTPRKTCTIRFECGRLPLTSHSFDTPARDPFMILIHKTSYRWIRTCYCIPNSYFKLHRSCAAFSLPAGPGRFTHRGVPDQRSEQRQGWTKNQRVKT